MLCMQTDGAYGLRFPRGKENMHRRNGKQGWKSTTSLMQQNNLRINYAMLMNEDGRKYNNNKGKQKNNGFHLATNMNS